jgi:hypothetical protein
VVDRRVDEEFLVSASFWTGEEIGEGFVKGTNRITIVLRNEENGM